MHNYENEIALPEDAVMRKFLWADYFHDSIIADIRFDNSGRTFCALGDTITLKIYSDRDCEKLWNALPPQKRPKHWSALLAGNRKEVTYKLTFSGVSYFDMETDSSGLYYLNGRFKETRLLRKKDAVTGKKNYHFRIQVTGGYLDVVFRKVQVRKETGRVNYSTKGYSFEAHKPRKVNLDFVELNKREIDDFDWFMNLKDLYDSGNENALQYARDCLNAALSIVDAKPYAAYVLGKLGDKNDLPAMREVYRQTEDALQKRHILDAIEELETAR